MEIISHHLHASPSGGERIVAIPVSRDSLARRRWRAIASDGREFGFDLDHSLAHGDLVFRDGATFYSVVQQEEPVIEIPLSQSPSIAARIAWQIGNLHFPVQITDSVIRVAEDSAIRQMLQRGKVPYVETRAVFCPFTSGAHHHHHHD